MSQPTPVSTASCRDLGQQPLTTPPSRSTGALRLVVVLVLTLGIIGSSTLIPVSAVSAYSTDQVLEAQLLQQLNGERAARGLPALRSDAGLEGASSAWSDGMASSQTLVHSTAGRAEIIARGWWTGQITDAWMRSPGHRNLIVDPNLVVAGVGVTCDAQGQMWATVQFYQANTSLGTLGSSAASPIATAPTVGTDCGEGVLIGQVRRLYVAYFRRESDQAGLAYWVGRMSQGTGLNEVSSNFAASAEFKSIYGKVGNADFVRLVYRNVMGREPETGGFQYWVSRLDQGTSRGGVMTGFSESGEFRSRSGIN